LFLFYYYFVLFPRAREAEIELESLRKKLAELTQAPLSAQASPPRGHGTLTGRTIGPNPPQPLAKPTNLQPPGTLSLKNSIILF
jgi:hypothetical protein